MFNKPKLAICWIGIGDYNALFDDFYTTMKEKFCTECDRTFFIFTDQSEKYNDLTDCKVYTISHACKHKGFVLFRKFKYLLMAEDQYLNYDYVVYCNGNMTCKQQVTLTEFLPYDKNYQITVCYHPSNHSRYYNLTANTWYINNKSMASFIPYKGQQYCQAGLTFCTRSRFLHIANTIEGWRHIDKANNADQYVPWHDESYCQKYLYLYKDIVNFLEGKVYLCPSTFSCADTAKIVLTNKKEYFAENNLTFVRSRPQDLYTL